MAPQRGIICWDLDETLGGFRCYDSSYDGLDLPVGVRHGAFDCLIRLRGKGFRHVITTSASRDYAELVLERTGLDVHMSAVFHRGIVSRQLWGKCYRPVLEHFSIREADAYHSMIVIGDRPTDRPIDINLVFVEQDRGYVYDSALLERTIELLMEGGAGSFARGFDFVFQNARAGDWPDHRGRAFPLGDGAVLVPDYRSNTESGGLGTNVIPALRLVPSPSQKRDLDAFEL